MEGRTTPLILNLKVDASMWSASWSDRITPWPTVGLKDVQAIKIQFLPVTEHSPTLWRLNC